jgi:MFS family permease
MSHEAVRTAPAEPEEPVAEPPQRLSAQHSFMLLWAGQSVSMLGNGVTTVVLPLVAVVSLNASGFQVGMLGFLQTLPFLLLSLFIGVVVDRVRRRRLLIAADLGRAIAIGVIPLLALVGWLSIGALYACVLVVGVLTVVFDLAYFAYTPRLLPQELLLAGNSRLELSNQVTGFVGPGLAGAAIAVVRIPFVLALDAVSFVVSAGCLLMIKDTDPPPKPSSRATPGQVVTEIGQGLRALFGSRYLRPVVLNATAYNVSAQMILTLFVLYATRQLQIPPGWIGLIFACGALGGVAGSVVINRAARRYRFGPTFLASMAIVRVALPLVAVVRGGPTFALVGAFAVIWFATLFGLVASNACVMTLRQVAVPDELRGRMNAGYRALSFGGIPLGALLAGVLASVIGVHETIAVAAVLVPLSLLFVIFSPVPRMKVATDAAPRDRLDASPQTA